MSAPFKVTHVFEGATVKGKVSKAVIDSQQRITIRLQGIDATELHYRPTNPVSKPSAGQKAAFNAANGNFRQPFGETATIELNKFLSKAGASPIACVVRTAVDTPGEVFDTFGRFIGDIIVKIGGKEQNANQWLAASGWAFPTFYSSMSAQEINDLIKLSEKARQAKAGIWKKATSDLTPFDRKMVFRKNGVPDPAKDVGPAMMPKMFRRRSTYGVAKVANLVSGSLQAYLKAHPDHCFKTSEFLSQGPTAATPHLLDQFVTAQSQFTVAAKDLVFQELGSRVIGKNGKPVLSF